MAADTTGATLDAARGGDWVDSDFLKQLAAVIRAEDSYGTWDGKTDAEIMAEFIVTKEERREIPIIGDPDPDVLWRVEKFYAAVGLAVEAKAGHIASPMMKMSHEGFGRVILTVGRLVVLSKTLRDVHRFGFESLSKMKTEADKHLSIALELVGRYPEVAGL